MLSILLGLVLLQTATHPAKPSPVTKASTPNVRLLKPKRSHHSISRETENLDMHPYVGRGISYEGSGVWCDSSTGFPAYLSSDSSLRTFFLSNQYGKDSFQAWTSEDGQFRLSATPGYHCEFVETPSRITVATDFTVHCSLFGALPSFAPPAVPTTAPDWSPVPTSSSHLGDNVVGQNLYDSLPAEQDDPYRSEPQSLIKRIPADQVKGNIVDCSKKLGVTGVTVYCSE